MEQAGPGTRGEPRPKVDRVWMGLTAVAALFLVGFVVYIATRPHHPKPVAYPVTAPAALAIGSTAPPFELPRLGGGVPVSLASTQGTPTVVNFFASWCRDCQAELADFAALSSATGGHVAIIGVETFYGRNTGSYRVADALTTLTFDYPRRAEFFRNELKQFLLLAREQNIAPLAPKGSYAGAQGLPQFMPGSLRDYAVDYDDDGTIDLAADADDAIGSVANYLARHGWLADDPAMEPAEIDDGKLDEVERALDGGISAGRTLESWRRDGVGVSGIPEAPGADPTGVLMLEGEAGPSYWVVFNNWYVLTRYNRSRLYASAVWKLAQEIKQARAGQ